MSEADRYDYQLPPERIAQHPLPRRADARLLVVNRAAGSFTHAHVRDLPEFVRAGDCLVINVTRVLPARIVGYRTRTGGRWEGLFLSTGQSGEWLVLAKSRSRPELGETITLRDRQARDDVELTLLAPLGEGRWAVRPASGESANSILHRVGRVPLPHYIRGGEMVEQDWEAYQTVFASEPGSVAAPTAGLHFTRELLTRLEAAGVDRCELTLHVGPGTFRPLSGDRLADHRMSAEWGKIDEPTVERLRAGRAGGGRVIAVGSTSLRVLETAAAGGEIEPWEGTTDLFIRPPFTFHAADALLTNFHLPRTTLLVLVRTFGGDELMRAAYEEAIREQYRFFSYGDAMLIL
jgi:S-adenosylmethionine:tRNA ribosyltransferase-isomerase